jgi:hypothetical protein
MVSLALPASPCSSREMKQLLADGPPLPGNTAQTDLQQGVVTMVCACVFQRCGMKSTPQHCKYYHQAFVCACVEVCF